MSITDRIRKLFGRKPSSAEYGAATIGVAVAATTGDDPGRDADQQSGSSGLDGSESGGGSGGGDGGSGGGDGGGGS